MYEIERANVSVGTKSVEQALLRVVELGDGKHDLEFGKVELPIEIKNEHDIEIQLDEARGDLKDASCSINVDNDTLFNIKQHDLKAFRFSSPNNAAAITIFGEHGVNLYVEKHDKPPKEITLRSVINGIV